MHLQEAIAAQAMDVSVMLPGMLFSRLHASAPLMAKSELHLLYHPAHAVASDVPVSPDRACLRLQEAIAAQAMDVEDLARQGRAKGTCPYYAARAAAASADLVLMPYSTLLSQVHSCFSGPAEQPAQIMDAHGVPCMEASAHGRTKASIRGSHATQGLWQPLQI